MARDQVNEKSRRKLKAEIDAWAAETRLLIGACRLLIEYFGTKKELQSWDAAIESPLAWTSIVARQFDTHDHHRGPPLRRWDEEVPFRCSEGTARIVSPLVEIIGGPIAKFVFTIRKLLPKPDQSRYIHSYGHFSVSFAEAVTQPLWGTFRDLAPEEWKACFPEHARRPGRRPRTRKASA